MCFGDDARPPLPPVRGGAVDSDDLVLTPTDGIAFRDVISAMSAPLLLLAAGQDNTPVADVEAFAEDVRAAGTDAEARVYPDAVHSFPDRKFEEYSEECDDAWRRMLDFMERHA